MISHKRPTALALAGALATAPFLYSSAVFADQTQPNRTATDQMDAVAQTSNNAEDGAMVKTVDEAYWALRDIRAARFAIFNGSTDSAAKFIDSAHDELQTAQALTKDFAVKTQKQAASGDSYIPFDASLAISEGFAPTKEKQKSLDKANGQLSSGDHQKAAETLRDAGIDVTVAAALIPAKASVGHVDDARKLMGQQKYYEANLALKAVEDAVIVESYDIDAVPMQGAHG